MGMHGIAAIFLNVSTDNYLWQEQFQVSKEVKKKRNGHVDVPKSNTELYQWIKTQRKDYKKCVRKKKGPFVKQNHRIKLLEDIGVDLDPLDML